MQATEPEFKPFPQVEVPVLAPRAPGRLPLAGHGPRLLADPLGFVASLRELGDVVSVRVGAEWLNVVTCPELLQQVLADEESAFGPGRLSDGFHALLGTGPGAEPAPDHRARRAVVEPPFHWSKLAGYARIAADSAAEVVGSWDGGTPVDLPQEMVRVFLLTMARSLVAESPEDRAAAVVTESLPAVLDSLPANYRRQFLPRSFAASRPTAVGRRSRTAVAAIRTALLEAIDRRRDLPDRPDDILSALLGAAERDGGHPMTDDEICDQLIGLAVAGTEAPAAALSWTLYELSRHPAAEQHCTAELAAVLADRAPGAEAFTSLLYTRQVIGEALRCYSAPFLARRATRPVRLGDWQLEAGDEVLLSPYALHHDPTVFTSPDGFAPDRYLSPAARPLVIPFGSGAHACIGDGLAWLTMTVVLATVLSRWKVEPVSDGAVKPVPTGLTLRPSRFLATVSPR